MWYAKGSPANTPHFKTLRREDGNWPELASGVRDWLNKYVPPHALISVSLYEDKHPLEDSKGINAVITHAAGSDPADLSANDTAVKAGALYDMNIISGSGEWEDMFAEAKAKINAKGGQEGHLVASTNDSSNDGGFVIVLSWTAVNENNLRDAVRPSGCMEQCTIF